MKAIAVGVREQTCPSVRKGFIIGAHVPTNNNKYTKFQDKVKQQVVPQKSKRQRSLKPGVLRGLPS